jgi:hypothetical protein
MEKAKDKKKEIMINYTKIEIEMNRIKEDNWNRREGKRRKSVLVYAAYASFVGSTKV